MADVKISGLPASTTPLAGTEVLPVVQGATTKKVAVSDLTAGRAVSALSVTATTVNATTLDTNVAAAGVTLSGTTLSADGTDTNIDINITPKGTGAVKTARVHTTNDVLTGGITSTTYNGSLYRSTGSIELTAGSSINISSVICGAAVVAVYSTGLGTGGLFFLNFGSTSVKITGDGEATDTGSSFAVFKSASSHTSTLKNKAAITQTFSVVVLAGRLS